jgi:hypothetical protein
LLNGLSETARAHAVIASDDAVHDNAKLINPPEMISASASWAAAMTARPTILIAAPATIVTRRPERSANRPNRGLRQAPDNVLHRDGQREISGRQRQVLRDWRKEQPKALAYSHARLSNNTAVPIKISRVWLLPATTVRGIPGAIPHLILTVV